MLSEIVEFLKDLVNEEAMRSNESWWYGWKYTSFENALADFEYLLERVLERLGNVK